MYRPALAELRNSAYLRFCIGRAEFLLRPATPLPHGTFGWPYATFLFLSAAQAYIDGTPYSGPVAGIQTELNLTGTIAFSVTSHTPDVFIVTGTGEDYLNVASGGGNNIMDGGMGSNFLVGGAGTDTFYVDARNPTANIWSTLQNFHSGDAATVWGVTPQDFALTWLDGQGAPGATGLTGVFTAVGKAEVGVTLAGFTSADLTDGRLAISYGRTADQSGLPGSTYMHIGAT